MLSCHKRQHIVRLLVLVLGDADYRIEPLSGFWHNDLKFWYVDRSKIAAPLSLTTRTLLV